MVPSASLQAKLEYRAMTDLGFLNASERAKKTCMFYQINTEESRIVPWYYLPEKLSTGCQIIDSIMNGGLLTGEVVGVWGESACGKSQLAMQLAVTSMLPKKLGGLECENVYFMYTDGLHTQRLNRIIEHFEMKYPGELSERPMNKILVDKIIDKEHLLHCVHVKLRHLRCKKTRLVIIDSFASVFRGYYVNFSELESMNDALLEFAEKENAIILLINQASFNPNENVVVPYLGKRCWESMTSTRLNLKRNPRRMIIESSVQPYPVVLPFNVTDNGIEDA